MQGVLTGHAPHRPQHYLPPPHSRMVLWLVFKKGTGAEKPAAGYHPDRRYRRSREHVPKGGRRLAAGHCRPRRPSGGVFRAGLHRRPCHQGRADCAVREEEIAGAVIDGGGPEVGPHEASHREVGGLLQGQVGYAGERFHRSYISFQKWWFGQSCQISFLFVPRSHTSSGNSPMKKGTWDVTIKWEGFTHARSQPQATDQGAFSQAL